MDISEELDRLVESHCHQAGNSSWPVYSFKDDKIIIIEAELTLVAGVWPNPMAWYKTPGRPWRQTWKWANRLIVPNLIPPYSINKAGKGGFSAVPLEAISPDADWVGWFAQRQNALRAYARTFPEEVLSLALRYSNGQWHMLCFMAGGLSAIYLVRSNPALAYCLANHKLFEQGAAGSNSMLEAQSRVHEKQHDILKRLGFPCTEAARKIMQKVVPVDVSIRGMRILRKAMTNARIVRALSRLPQINKPVLLMVNDPASLNSITHAAFKELSGQDNPYFAEILRGIRELEDALNLKQKTTLFSTLQAIRSYESRLSGLGVKLVIFPLNKGHESDITSMERLLNLEPHEMFDSIKEIMGYHNHLTASLRQVRLEEFGVPNVFPDSPYVGTDTIIPINTLDELLKEEETMLMRVTDRAHRIAEGMEYVYRVFAPVRGTLSIEKDDMGIWKYSNMLRRRSFDVDAHIASAVFRLLTNSHPNQLSVDKS